MANRAGHWWCGVLDLIVLDPGGSRGVLSSRRCRDRHGFTASVWLLRAASPGNVTISLQNLLSRNFGVLLEEARVVENRLEVFWNLRESQHVNL